MAAHRVREPRGSEGTGRLARRALAALSSRSLLLAFGCLASLALGELLLALLGEGDLDRPWQGGGLHALDDQLIYVPRPNAESRWKTEHFVENVRTNSLALRGPEPLGAERRILVLGDSMTFGHGVSDHESFPYLLQERLREGGRDVEVLNAGVKGYGLEQTYQRFRLRLRSLAPDLLILSVYGNDLSDSLSRPLFLIDGDELVPRDMTRDSLYRYLRLQRRVPDWLEHSRIVGLLVRRWAHFGALPAPEFANRRASVRWARRKAELLIRDLGAMTREDGGRLALVNLPVQKRRRDPYAWLPSLGDEVPHLDLHGDSTWRERGDELFLPEDYHLTVAGNRWVAAELAGFLERRGLVAQPPQAFTSPRNTRRR